MFKTGEIISAVVVISLLCFGCNKDGSPSGTESTGASGCISNPPEEVNTPGSDNHNGKKDKRCKHRHHKKNKHQHDTLPGETPGDTTSDSDTTVDTPSDTSADTLSDTTSGTNDDANPCASRQFAVDANTLALYHFNETGGTALIDETGQWNGILSGGSRTTGAFGNGLSFAQGQYAEFNSLIPDGTPEGTVDAYILFKPGFDANASYIIFGTDGSRCNLFYSKGSLIFMKNQNNVFKYVTAAVSLEPNRWYHVAGTWGSKGMRLFLDCVLLASNMDTSCYESSPRTALENLFHIGKKSWCCMEALGIGQEIGFCGDIDEIRVSKVDRY
jgi:hypothetical protein